MSDTVLVALGRFGDQTNILPAIPFLEKDFGRITLMVAERYAEILQGITYANKDVFSGPFEAINDALSFARKRYKHVLCSQVYGWGFDINHRTDSFCKESWYRLGLLDKFRTTPLVFDNRNLDIEEMLCKRIPQEKPWILLAANGFSSPFSAANILHSEIQAKWGDKYQIVNMADIKAPRFFDLLGLMDRAKLLISIDTGILHLARASKVPVISLITARPSLWHGAIPPENSILSMRYSDFNIHRIHKAIESL